ncbi:helix-turn-helix domain-containing protein [Vibrio parahaemolyticus]|uniref:helix-turn-helix domain-containing protein n=1 Tax=Vibrio parahaemolyticus TaxID=670 RepID=UPI00226B66EA|nr:helix-turn-helix transcriptional regulator [Vibrio parahaemolyticus]MCX8941236.1 helix-turn-helix transcriptional regulator [Vibrio parahaemolyticus]
MKHKEEKKNNSTEIEELKLAWTSYRDRTAETQISAAHKLGITQATFSQYLTGYLKLNPMFILKICRMMGVNPSSIRPSMSCIFGNKKGKRLLDQIDKAIEALSYGK